MICNSIDMIKKLCVIIAVFMFSTSTSAQLKISADSLLKLVKIDGSIYKTFENRDLVDKIDYKNCYGNDSLKYLMLKLLDEDEFFVSEAHRVVDILWSKEHNRQYYLDKWLVGHNKVSIKDSLSNDLYLLNLYLDSAYYEECARTVKVFKKTSVIPQSFASILSRMKWPEVYAEYYNQWCDDGKRFDGKRFAELLVMHCPEALAVYENTAIRQYEQGNFNGLYLGCNEELGSYHLKFHLLTLVCTAPIHCHLFDGGEPGQGPEVPLNLEKVYTWFFYYNHLIPIVKDFGKKFAWDPLDDSNPFSRKEFFKVGQEIKDSVDVFRLQFQPEIEKLEREELYWKQNMPYYKGNNDCQTNK